MGLPPYIPNNSKTSNMKYEIKRNIPLQAEENTNINTELIRVIRELTNAGYLFEIRNGYNGNGRAFYMINVLSRKSE